MCEFLEQLPSGYNRFRRLNTYVPLTAKVQEFSLSPGAVPVFYIKQLWKKPERASEEGA